MTATATLPPAPVFDAPVSCQRCQASVVWVRTEAHGKSMPLNPKPSRDGNVVMVPLGHSRHYVARVLPPEQLPPADGSPTFLPHFATCGGRAPRARSEFTKTCVRCGAPFVASTLKAVERAFYAHYASHLNTCEQCEAPIRWIRQEIPGGGVGAILMLDPELVDVADVVLVRSHSQMLARPLNPESLLEVLPGYRLHEHQVVPHA